MGIIDAQRDIDEPAATSNRGGTCAELGADGPAEPIAAQAPPRSAGLDVSAPINKPAHGQPQWRSACSPGTGVGLIPVLLGGPDDTRYWGRHVDKSILIRRGAAEVRKDYQARREERPRRN